MRFLLLPISLALLSLGASAQHQGTLKPVFTGYTNNNQSLEPTGTFLTMVPQLSSGQPPITYTQANLPTGLSINASNGQITKTGTPSPAPWSATITATNSYGFGTFVVSGTFGWHPIFNGYTHDAQSIELSEDFVTMVPDLSQGTGTITYSEVNDFLPSGLTLNTSTGQITKTGAVALGAWTATIRATNAWGSGDVDIDGTIRKDRVDFGINLNFPVDYSRTFPFTNLFLQSSRWKNETTPANEVPLITSGDAKDYPNFTTIPTVTVSSYSFSSGLDSYSNKASPLGTYRLEWRGHATSVSIDGFGSDNGNGTDADGVHWRKWDNKEPTAIQVKIQAGDLPGNDPVYDVRVYPPDFATNANGSVAYNHTNAPTFWPRFIELLRGVTHDNDLAKGPIRFLDWDHVNYVGGAPNADWKWYVKDTFDNSRLTLTNIRQSERPDHSRPPVAYEYMIQLCNELNCDMWVNVPHQKPDPSNPSLMNYTAFCQGLAHLIATTLEPELHVYVEWSNEWWNSGFPVNGWVSQQAGILGITPKEFRVQKILEMYSIMKQQFIDDDREDQFRLVVMGQVNNDGHLGPTLATMHNHSVPSPIGGTFNVNTDLYGAGCSFYFRATEDTLDEWTDNMKPGGPHNLTVAQMLLDVSTDMNVMLAGGLADHKAIVKTTYNGPKFMCYEGGISCGGVPVSYWSNLWFSLQKDPGIYDLYRDAIDMLRDNDVDLACHYAFLFKLDDPAGGSWQLIENEDQIVGNPYGTGFAPKYDAWIEGPAATQ